MLMEEGGALHRPLFILVLVESPAKNTTQQTPGESMKPDEYRSYLKDHRVSQQMVAAALGCAMSQVSLALNGQKPAVYAQMLERCGRDWIMANARAPLPPRPILALYDPALVERARESLLALNDAFGNGDVGTVAELYQGAVRACHSYVVYHYFGLIRDAVRLIDDAERERLCVDHVFSIADACEARIPYWVVASPVNLAVILERDNQTKGRRSAMSAESLKQQFESFITTYPRYWIVISQSLTKIGIPKPYSEAERAIGQRQYRSTKTGRAFHEAHQHRWGNSDTEMTITFNLNDLVSGVFPAIPSEKRPSCFGDDSENQADMTENGIDC
jgi:hypothetical protein